jgi:hypothetical protein
MKTSRVQVPMSEETRLQLQALADAQGCSLAAVCRDMLIEVAPMAEQIAKSLQIAKQSPAKALREISASLDAQMALANQFRLHLETKRKPRKYRKAS